MYRDYPPIHHRRDSKLPERLLSMVCRLKANPCEIHVLVTNNSNMKQISSQILHSTGEHVLLRRLPIHHPNQHLFHYEMVLPYKSMN